MISRMSDKRGAPATEGGFSRAPACVTGSVSVAGSGLDSITGSNFMLCLSSLPVSHLRASSDIQKCPVLNYSCALPYAAVVGDERALDGFHF